MFKKKYKKSSKQVSSFKKWSRCPGAGNGKCKEECGYFECTAGGNDWLFGRFVSAECWL